MYIGTLCYVYMYSWQVLSAFQDDVGVKNGVCNAPTTTGALRTLRRRGCRRVFGRVASVWVPTHTHTHKRVYCVNLTGLIPIYTVSHYIIYTLRTDVRSRSTSAEAYRDRQSCTQTRIRDVCVRVNICVCVCVCVSRVYVYIYIDRPNNGGSTVYNIICHAGATLGNFTCHGVRARARETYKRSIYIYIIIL